jgi:hypothetical protein|uniref:Nuclear transport factor 2 n=1 Tax=Eutreptiella gymnastica TaxID=73025 RepID=A0A7S4FIK9_9EUGL|mmetsp:Transcript_46684/g.78354  ORF Transcript_46684/g.78354 Transcript_46684/m.78354 type:complete len:122 (-) Transcript_46684:568-933(-)|eukprot:CAMPEP_0174286334 /NCGR_PEP_ID=MMETSP0809-20121228/11475_1 /TAXON_ID=73025 ORGANISM="Eutreptiella gymnastica-like, Strain CCMP1594" /NCGR_SAMPLE_ID=MMETSP0809 /ASSEMBLY_ACC=CAM_ASM_000658 /LENGTH=121 /DNA_ID=CAMNT_0015382361 /DNA_START=98 /DNA_END=463 /DNA_ORIENTATION=+
MSEFEQIGKMFTQHYYNTFDTNRAALRDLYRDQSLMTFEGAQVQGANAIMEKFSQLTFKEVKHDVQTIDSQPSLTGGVLVMVSGQLKTDGDAPHRFCQMFHLVKEANNFWVSNDVFRLNYG